MKEGNKMSKKEPPLTVAVESIMRAPPVEALFSDNVLSVVNKMVAHKIGAVIIASGGRPVGIITERDILERIVNARKDPDKTKVSEIMSKPIITIEYNEPISKALKLMREKDIRRLAVTRGGNLIGIVTERRILDSLV